MPISQSELLEQVFVTQIALLRLLHTKGVVSLDAMIETIGETHLDGKALRINGILADHVMEDLLRPLNAIQQALDSSRR